MIVTTAVKAELNNDLRPGRFVLAGSTRSTAVPEVAEYLAGRVSFLAVLPLSQGEIEGARENFVETLMLGEPRSLVTNKRSETSRVEYRAADHHRWHADRAREERVLARTVVRRVRGAGP